MQDRIQDRNYTYRTDEHSFLRYWAGTSMMPALMCWGMLHGTFDDTSKPMTIGEIADQTGYSRTEVYMMCNLVDSLLVRETENATTDISR